MATAAAVLASGGVAAATDVIGDSPIRACFKHENGQVRIVSSLSACHDNELGLTWNQRGPVGRTGAQGDRGPEGARGVAGEKGAKGEQGDPGAPGEKGDQGDPGAPGEKGERGDPGAPGEKGEQGVPGEKGEPGDPGAQGQKGDPGNPGPPGPAGPQGEPGVGVVVRNLTVPAGESRAIPLLDGDGEVVLSGPDLCQVDYRNAGGTGHVLYPIDGAPSVVGPGASVPVGRGYPAGTPRERTVFDQRSSRSAWFKVVGYAVVSLPGGSGGGCRFQVLLAE